MTPLEASKPENKDEVKLRLELQRRNDNQQPKLKVGDEVRVLRKKKNFEKGYTSHYSEKTYKIMDVIQAPPQRTNSICSQHEDESKGVFTFQRQQIHQKRTATRKIM